MTNVKAIGLLSALLLGVAGTTLAVLAVGYPADGQSQSPATAVPAKSTTSTTTTTPQPPALREGDRGPGVAGLQATLHRLGYQAPTTADLFDDETSHAVVAFQKVHDLPRTGVVDVATHRALAAPTTPRPRSTAPGFHVEVDLARQVTYAVTDGEVTNVYDSSSGAPDSPTPTGTFEITYQIDGWRYAPLGDLYRPSYFTYDGIAFHGGQAVEPQPASHGCIRLTDPTINAVFDQLTPGTAVLVY